LRDVDVVVVPRSRLRCFYLFAPHESDPQLRSAAPAETATAYALPGTGAFCVWHTGANCPKPGWRAQWINGGVLIRGATQPREFAQ
jgi:hypothetical protein